MSASVPLLLIILPQGQIICFLIYIVHAALSNIINTDAKLTKSKKKTRKP